MPIRHLVTSFATCLLASLLLLSPSVAKTASDRQALHLLNRLAFGPTLEDLQHVDAIGFDRYIEEQLNPQTIPEPPELIQRLAALDTLQLDSGSALRGLWAPAAPGRRQAPGRGDKGPAGARPGHRP